jgi:PncC family amidohydrolase
LIDVDIFELASDVVQSLCERGLRVAFAESCTGGLAAAAITNIPGSSQVLEVSVVTYANSAKIEYTDVTADVLDAYGAVSAETALLMAEGIRRRTKSDIGVGITGVAGPGGENLPPVGTVYIALSFPAVAIHEAQHFLFAGTRCGIRESAVEQALTLLRGLL